jgi:hypothetical protein
MENMMRICNTCHTPKEDNEFRGTRKRCKKCNDKLHWKYAKKNPVKIMLISARQRAKRDGIEFSLVDSDVVIPEICPVLGIKLVAGDRHNHDFAPTIDRMDSSRGYTTDNIVVVSHRANRIKADATIDELTKIVLFYEVTRSVMDTAERPLQRANMQP